MFNMRRTVRSNRSSAPGSVSISSGFDFLGDFFAMSTPRTRKPRRYKTKISDTPHGSYSQRIDPDNFALAIGRLATAWPYVEEQMVGLFAELLDIADKQSARLIFRSIINQNIRITIMRNLLEKSPRHKDKAAYFDELLEEFGALNVARNKYLHGLWYTYQDHLRVFLEERGDTYDKFLVKREVPLKEIHSVHTRMNDLSKKLIEQANMHFSGQDQSSP